MSDDHIINYPRPSHRVSDKMGEMLNSAIERLGDGEDIRWECSIAMIPANPSMPPHPQTNPISPQITMAFWMPSGLVDMYATNVVIWSAIQDQGTIDRAFVEVLETLRQTRSNALAEAHVEVVASNGHKEPEAFPGLVFPPGTNPGG